MRNTICLILLILTGCNPGDVFMINGHMKDALYDGEYIYLVPLENSSIARTDSALIANGKFEIKGSAETPEIYIVRARPLLRLKLQELLVVKEQGVLKVNIGNSSQTGGTALNDSLQKWKENKMMSDSLYYQLLGQYKAADITLQSQIKQKADSLNTMNLDFNYRFVRNNLHNVVGKFVNKVMGDSFSPEQKKNLNLK
jgi:hypothetical protein